MLNQIKKKILLICLIALIIILVFVYFRFQGEKQKQQIKELLNRLTEAVNLMESVKDKMPEELLAVHDFLVKQVQENKIKLYQIPPELKEFVMVHGAKHKVLYVDPSVRLKPQIWIPLLYHEAAHLYWHQKHSTPTFEEFQEFLFDSEVHSYTVDAQAWNIVKEYFPVKEEKLNYQELKLFNIYEREISLYNRMIEGDAEAEAKWNKIIEEDIRVQKEQQGLLK